VALLSISSAESPPVSDNSIPFFEIVAWVLLPDHMHAIWQLPEDDADYPHAGRTSNAAQHRLRGTLC
jgi:REP element-mobilizing transposase RayT